MRISDWSSDVCSSDLLSVEAPSGSLTEMAAADRLQALREDTGCLVDLSFDTISGAGPNGAVVHYRAEEKTNRAIEMGTLYRVASGGQYRHGTPDVTRLVALGTPTDEMHQTFTLVLKGTLSLARAQFTKKPEQH